MSTAGTPIDLIPPEKLAEAGVWIARLHGDDRSREMEAGLRLWLQESPLNARAFELATDVWNEAQNLRRVMPLPLETRWRPKRFSLALASAAGLILVAILSTFLFRSNRVVTSVGEQRMLTLSDGTRVYLNTATRVVVRYDSSTRRVELEAGEALFDVARATDRPFIVTSGDEQVTALGTSFVVRRDDRRVAITLVDGKVSVSPPSSSNPVTLAPGQRLTFTADGPAQMDTPSLDKVVAWRRGQLVLDDTQLANAVAEMNRYSPVPLVIERPQDAQLLVSGLFQVGDSLSFAHAVAEMHGLRVVETGTVIVLAGPGGTAEPPGR
jgi:transmembrane sensor